MAVADSGWDKTGDHDGLRLPFGYYLERDAGLLLLRRADVPTATVMTKTKNNSASNVHPPTTFGSL